jgi:hypothetical protein
VPVVRPVPARYRPGAPGNHEVLQQLAEHRPRSWQGWIASGRPAIRTGRTQLEAGLCIRVEHRTILPDRAELRDRLAVKQYADEVRAELRGPASRGERREYQQRLDELAVYTGPIADSLGKAWRARKAHMASG